MNSTQLHLLINPTKLIKSLFFFSNSSSILLWTSTKLQVTGLDFLCNCLFYYRKNKQKNDSQTELCIDRVATWRGQFSSVTWLLGAMFLSTILHNQSAVYSLAPCSHAFPNSCRLSQLSQYAALIAEGG